jgi:hypothetical protein
MKDAGGRGCRSGLAGSATAALLFAMLATPAAAQAPDTCKPTGQSVPLAGLPEASGAAASRRVPGRIWTHNDSGAPVVVALDANGAVTGRLRLTNARLEDWEAIAVGPCPGGSCLYVADIGDNDAERKRVTVYRVPEPENADGSIAVTDVFHGVYPDGRHDAETVLVTADGTLLIVTKGDTGPVALYRFPAELKAGTTHSLERVGKPRASGKPAAADRVTDGDVSADGEWTVLRTRRSLSFHRTADLLQGNWQAERTVDLAAVGEPQGEGVAFGADGTLYLLGEGGGKKRPGTFQRLTCLAPAAGASRR